TRYSRHRDELKSDIAAARKSHFGSEDGTPVTSPVNGKVIGHIPFANPRDIDDAISRASVAFEPWRARPAAQRAGLLRKIADQL
ncbi:MAG: aldehyde dehydrogenase family protein, partial [Pseudomonadales bacterium]|nr:aldehyde dehydrogenase family protein [Pseudomonadales bacterium]